MVHESLNIGLLHLHNDTHIGIGKVRQFTVCTVYTI